MKAHFIAPSGKIVKLDTDGSERPRAVFERVLESYRKLPESDRKPPLEDRGTYKMAWYATNVSAPPGALVVNVYNRPLKRVGPGNYRGAKGKDIDLTSEFGGRGALEGDGEVHGPGRDTLWLTEKEWRSFIPQDPREGQRVSVAENVRRRIFLLYTQNQVSQTDNLPWRSKSLRSGELTLTVERATPAQVLLRLEGFAFLEDAEQMVDAQRTGQKGLPAAPRVSYDARFLGKVAYDPAQKRIERFDVVALGDFKGTWMYAYKADPAVPLGIAFELETREWAIKERPRPFVYAFRTADNIDYWTGK